jgi:hypothetical protein
MRHTLAQAAIADGGPDSAVRDLKKRLIEQRLISIVGPGGIGKTAVGFAVAHDMLPEFAGAVQFLDFAAIENPQLVGSALASPLGLPIVLENPLPVILAFPRERRVLLVFDGCERVIEATAALAEKIFRDAPQVQILATSRAPYDQVRHGCVRWRAGSHPAAPHCGSASSKKRLPPPSELGQSSEPTTSNVRHIASAVSSVTKQRLPKGRHLKAQIAFLHHHIRPHR